MATTQHGARINRALWKQATAKILTIRRPGISATAVWIDALQTFVAETDPETITRYAADGPRIPTGPRSPHNALIDTDLWDAALAKSDRLRQRGRDINATSEWTLGLIRFVAETEAESIARLAGRHNAGAVQ
jgi:hypothetical protein